MFLLFKIKLKFLFILSNSTTNSSRFVRTSSTKMKKLPERQTKPYTPVYSTLLSNNDDEFLLDKYVIEYKFSKNLNIIL